MASFEKKLPIEQWQQVLRNVSCGDLCSVMLTSRHMNRVAIWPELWVGMKVNLGKVRENGLAQLYSINRFKRIKQIDFRGSNFTSTELGGLFTDIPGSPLESVDFGSIDLRGVPPELLASSVGRLKTITLWNTQLTTEQCIKILETILSSTVLINVDLGHINLSEVDPVLLASAVSRLNTINLYNSGLKTGQCIKLLEASISSTTLSPFDLSRVPPVLLASAVGRLNTVILHNSGLTTDQCIKVLEASISSTTLISIDLSSIDLSSIPSNLLASAVSRLKTANVSATHLTTDQCIEVLEASISSTTLVNVDLHSINLNEVPPNILASAVSRLKTVKLDNSGLTTDQCIKVLEASISSMTLISIDLSTIDLSEVPPILLASAVSHLKTVNVSVTHLTIDQCIKVLEASISSTTLFNIDLGGVNLSGVPPVLLASAVSRLNTVNLDNSELTRDQCIKVLEASISSATLINLELQYIDLSGVPPNLLASAVSHLQTVNLVFSDLTTEQCVAVLKGISSSTTSSHVNLRGNNFINKIPTDLQYLITSLPPHFKF